MAEGFGSRAHGVVADALAVRKDHNRDDVRGVGVLGDDEHAGDVSRRRSASNLSEGKGASSAVAIAELHY